MLLKRMHYPSVIALAFLALVSAGVLFPSFRFLSDMGIVGLIAVIWALRIKRAADRAGPSGLFPNGFGFLRSQNAIIGLVLMALPLTAIVIVYIVAALTGDYTILIWPIGALPIAIIGFYTVWRAWTEDLPYDRKIESLLWTKRR